MKYFFLLLLLFFISCSHDSKKAESKIKQVKNTQSASQLLPENNYKKNNTNFKQPKITQSSEHLKPGDNLEIDVQVNPFNDSAKAKIKFDNIDVPFNPDGIAIYVKEMHAEYGQHTVPILITYYSQTEELGKRVYSVKYSIEH